MNIHVFQQVKDQPGATVDLDASSGTEQNPGAEPNLDEFETDRSRDLLNQADGNSNDSETGGAKLNGLDAKFKETSPNLTKPFL